MVDFRTFDNDAEALAQYIDYALVRTANDVLAEAQGAFSTEAWEARAAYARRVVRGLSYDESLAAAKVLVALQLPFGTANELLNSCASAWSTLSGARTG